MQVADSQPSSPNIVSHPDRTGTLYWLSDGGGWWIRCSMVQALKFALILCGQYLHIAAELERRDSPALMRRCATSGSPCVNNLIPLTCIRRSGVPVRHRHTRDCLHLTLLRLSCTRPACVRKQHPSDRRGRTLYRFRSLPPESNSAAGACLRHR